MDQSLHRDIPKAYHETFPDNALGGRSLLDLGKEFGLPLYVYSGDRIAHQVSRLQKAFAGSQMKLRYAMKALSNPMVIRAVLDAGAGIDCVSIEEIKLALKAGARPEDVLFTTSCVPFREVMEAVELGIQINLDSLPAVEKFGKQYGEKVPLCVRLNPHIRAGGNEKIQTGHKESKFGISIEQLDELIAIVDRYSIDIAGIHVHTGSDIADPKAFTDGQGVMFQAARRFSNLRFIDFGGGFKVAYRAEDKAIDIDSLGKAMSDAFESFCEQYGRRLEMWFEPGKFLVSEAGVLLVEVTVVKQTPAITFVGVNSGLNHLIRPMMYGAYHHMVNLSNADGSPKEYSVVGYICETDTLGAKQTMSEVREGDVIAILNAGAYGYTMASNYNSKPRPAEIVVRDGKAFLATKRDTFDDVVRQYTFP